jgi:hypothetical protein
MKKGVDFMNWLWKSPEQVDAGVDPADQKSSDLD